jgi:hypothetical protein
MEGNSNPTYSFAVDKIEFLEHQHYRVVKELPYARIPA